MGTVTSDILVALVVLGVIIVIHELGHFVVAKLFKIKVETFSVGMGPRVIGYRRGDTDYRISAFPIGGYVKMAGETPNDTVTGDPREFLSKPKWQRFLVASAGPAMNVVLAVALLTGLYMYGSEVPEFIGDEAVVGIVKPDSPADRVRIQPGDRIVSLDGRERPNWQEVESRVVTNPDKPLAIVVERNGERIETSITPQRTGRAEMGYVGMGPVIRVVVQRVHPGSPAEAGGLKAGDEIVTVNGIDLKTSGQTIQDIIQGIPDKTFPITVLRQEPETQLNTSSATADQAGRRAAAQGQEIQLTVSPTMQDGRKIIGIDILYPTKLIKLGFAAAVQKSIDTNVYNAVLIFEVIGKLFKREASLKSLDGPIGIVRVSGQAFQMGLGTLISLAALISLNLGLLNVLPIPILDGGVMMLLVVESLMGRDISLRVKERIVQVSFVFLLMLTVFVLYNDVVKLLPPSNPTP